MGRRSGKITRRIARNTGHFRRQPHRNRRPQTPRTHRLHPERRLGSLCNRPTVHVVIMQIKIKAQWHLNLTQEELNLIGLVLVGKIPTKRMEEAKALNREMLAQIKSTT